MQNTIIKPTAPLLIEDLGMQYPNKKSRIKKRYGLYQCSCGNEFRSIDYSIKSGRQVSCGCYRNNKVKTHGMTHHPLYGTWSNMNTRCNNQNYDHFYDYGERGIEICERWKDINNFIDDMYPTFKEGLSIDRIDVNGNYEPNNCRWTNQSVQVSNTRLLKSTNKSGYRGVSFDKKSKKWVVSISMYKQRKNIGYFSSIVDAAIAYDTYVIVYGLNHPTNFIKGVFQ